MTRILAIPGYRNIYTANMKEFMTGGFALSAQEPNMLAWRNLAESWVQADTYYPRDWGFTFSDWQQALDLARGGHVQYGIRPYVQTRIATATPQLREGPLPAIISEVAWLPAQPLAGDEVVVTCRITDVASVSNAELLYSVSGGALVSTPLYDDGRHGDGATNDGLWAGAIPGQAPANSREFYLRVRGSAGAWTIYPDSAPFKKILLPQGTVVFPVVLNEFMASNSATLMDPAGGEFDDWVEIYNTADTAITLAGFFLTDNLANPMKWQFPDTTLAGKSFMLLWADEQAAQGPLHMAFKLGAGGEQLGLFAPQHLGTVPVDTLRVGAQTSDVSFGRNPDGGPAWEFLQQPSPGRSNAAASTVAEPAGRQHARPQSFHIESVQPNPARSATQLRLFVAQTGNYTLRIFDVSGREIRRQQYEFAHHGAQALLLPVSELKAGIYFVRMEGGKTAQAVKLMVLH